MSYTKIPIPRSYSNETWYVYTQCLAFISFECLVRYLKDSLQNKNIGHRMKENSVEISLLEYSISKPISQYLFPDRLFVYPFK